jgi:hypothetical protein
MVFRIAKIYAFRLWGLWLTLGGMLLMILGLVGVVAGWGLAGRIMAAVFMLLGGLTMMASLAVYFYAGMLSNQAYQLTCPSCGKVTKMLGKTDRCMFCKTKLTFDPSIATEFPEEQLGDSTPATDSEIELPSSNENQIVK